MRGDTDEYDDELDDMDEEDSIEDIVDMTMDNMFPDGTDGLDFDELLIDDI